MIWLIDTLLVTGALIAAVLVLRRPVARAFGPGMAYALWALPLLRLILPPLVLPAPDLPDEATVVPVFVSRVPQLAADAASAPPSVIGAWTPGFPVAEVLQAVWLAGALAYLVWRAWGYATMRRELLDRARPVGEVGAVRLVESPAASSPIAFGIRDQVVALPMGFMFHPDLAARDLAIAHELQHHAGRDLLVNIAVQPLLALHWFNPLAWLAWLALRRDQEAACDARVLAGQDARTRAVYGRLIAAFANGVRPSQAHALAAPMVSPNYLGPLLGDKSIIHRLRSLTMTEPSLRRRLLGRALIAAGALALPLTATITYAASDTPEPPAPPAAPEAPLAPEAPAAPAAPETWGQHGDHKIVIVERKGRGRGDDAGLHTRVIKRGGKTIVLKTDEDLSEAEVEARVARAEAQMAAAEVDDIEAPDIDVDVDIDSDKISRDVERSVRKSIVVANADEARKHAIKGIREARSEIEADDSMPSRIKRDVLEQLDREIAKLSR